MKIAEYIDKNVSGLPSELADILLQGESVWTNDACYGYCIIAMKNAGFKIMLPHMGTPPSIPHLDYTVYQFFHFSSASSTV